MFVGSMAIQQVQARKIRRAQEAAAEAAKGFQMVKSGESAAIPISYGRNKVGGIRVYHNTFSDFVCDTTINNAVTAVGGVIDSKNPVVLLPLAANTVRFFFSAPTGTDIYKVPNTSGAASYPVLTEVPKQIHDHGGNGTIGNGEFNGYDADGQSATTGSAPAGAPGAGMGSNSTDTSGDSQQGSIG